MTTTVYSFRFVYIWFLTFISLVLLDAIWFYFSFDRLYKPQFVKIQKRFTTRIWSAIFVWMMLSLLLAVERIQVKNHLQLCYRSLFLGLIVYGVYNFTNYATLYNYSIKTAIIDTAWGGCAFVLSAYLLSFVIH